MISGRRIASRTRSLQVRLATSFTAVLLAGMASPPGLMGQTQEIGATLKGMVEDASGAAIAGATVTVRSEATNQIRTAVTNEQGFFQIARVPIGNYTVRVERPGFAPYVHAGIRFSIGQTVQLSIALLPASVTSQVTVTAQPPPLDVSETRSTTIVDRERIEELPVRTRNSLDFVLLAPGVAASVPTNSAAGTALGASGFIFGGLRARSNNVSIDGLDNNDEYSGASRTELSPEIVQEFQVVNNGLSAEYGGASGGSINVVTRDGTNQLHGDAFVFAQTGAFDARDPIESEPLQPLLARYRAGVANGGPVVRDRTFYYAAFEQEYKRTQDSSDIDPGLATAINRFLSSGALQRLPTRRLTLGLFPVARAETEASGKLDHAINDRDSLMMRYAFTNNREAGDAFNTDGLTDATGRGSSFTADNALAGSLASLLSPRAVNDLRFQVAARRVTLRTNAQSGPGIEINGQAFFGRPYEGNSNRRENHQEVTDTLALSRAAHLWKLGGAANHVHLSAKVPDGFGGIFIFPTLEDFFSGNPDLFRQAFGDPTTRYGVTSYGGFIQDHWSVTRKLTADLGARYDFERLPSGFHQDARNVSPRVGLAFSPAERWVARAGFGIFYDRYVLANLNRAVEKDGRRGFEQAADGSAAATVFQHTDGGAAPMPLVGLPVSVYQPDPRLATPYSEQFNMGIEHELSTNLSIGVDYLRVRGVKLSRTRNANLLPPAVLSVQNASSLGVFDPSPQQLGRSVFGPGRRDPRFDVVDLLEDSASSSYEGLSLTLNRRMADEIEFAASYTLSRTLDDASDYDEQPENPYNLRREWSVSRNSQAQRLVFDGLFDLPFGDEPSARSASGRRSPVTSSAQLVERALAHVELASIITLGSGRPVNALTGLDSNRSKPFPLSARPLGFRRDSLRTPGIVDIDLRVLKYFPVGSQAHLDLVVECFNLLNHTNVSEINPFYGNEAAPLPDFTHPIEVLNPRQIQFSVDFEY